MSRLTTARQLIYSIKRNNLSPKDIDSLVQIESLVRQGYASSASIKELKRLSVDSSIKKQPELSGIFETVTAMQQKCPTIYPGEISLIPRARGRLSAEARQAWARAKEEQATSAALKDRRYVSKAHREMEAIRAKTREMLRAT